MSRRILNIAVLGVLGCIVAGVANVTAQAADHKVEKLESPPPAESLSPEIAGLLATNGLRVVRGASRTVCEIWLRADLPLIDEKLPTGVNYPLQPGQLVGAIRYPKKGADFRNQDVAEGVYTLRYSQQPVDGAHVGTSITRDFLLLSPADADKSPAVLDYKTLARLSAQAAGSNHPALLSLQKPADPGEAIRHVEESDWWIVRLVARGKNAKGTQELPLELVVVGHASE